MTDESAMNLREGTNRKRVRIVGDHPHRGATGTALYDQPRAFGDMVEVDLDAGALSNGCYAGPENLRALPPEEDPNA